MFSKKRQAKYEKDLRAKLAAAEREGTELDDELQLLKEKGVVKEIWKPVGMNIKYQRSSHERGGWSVPGPANMEEEEDVGAEQDDILATEGDGAATQNLSATMPEYRIRKRWFYQMTFDLEFPYKDDTVFLAYSRPYPYSKVLASVFDQEEYLRSLPQTN